MGRSPCCEKGGLKKGPWTPEEDIVLVSYIQEHGPGNWRMIPANTGLSRCSKSCRLRWTNYLRPGIKRGNFTPHEDRIIIHLQALLGNRWAAIASYLPRRTDNDIKNYWNTHLKKRLNRLQTPGIASNRFAYDIPFKRSSELDRVSKGQWETRLQTNIDLAKQALQEALCSGSSPLSGLQDSEIITNSNQLSTENLSSSVYSTLNLSKLLEGWKKSSLNKKKLPSTDDIPAATSVAEYSSSCCSEGYQSHEIPYYNSEMPIACKMAGLNSSDHSEILRSISPCNSGHQGYSYQEQCSLNALNVGNFTDNHQSSPDNKLPFLLLEKWLMEETGQADQLLSSSESGIAV